LICRFSIVAPAGVAYVIENRTARILVVSLLVLLVIPLLVMLGMMMFGGGMIGQMGVMQMHMGAGFMARCVLWTVLVAAALIGLIVLLTRDTGVTGRREVPSIGMHPPLRH
jgi:hypothetical protein